MELILEPDRYTILDIGGVNTWSQTKMQEQIAIRRSFIRDNFQKEHSSQTKIYLKEVETIFAEANKKGYKII